MAKRTTAAAKKTLGEIKAERTESAVAAFRTANDVEYAELELLIRTALPDKPLFTTDVDPDALWQAYLNGLPADKRQHYNCHCCRRFVQRIGTLVTINDDGEQVAALWHITAPPFFRDSVQAMNRLVLRAKVTGVFLATEKMLGWPQTNEWTHLASVNPKPYTERLFNAGQAMADKLQDYQILSQGLSDYPRETVEQAVRVLKADAVDRSEKALGVAEWFLKLHTAIAADPKARRNLVWLAVATAPPGFCHVRSTMISTLLDDIHNGLDFEVIKRRWKDKMHPLQYQRPTAPPRESTIKQAEELFAKLGLAAALRRRYATLDDVLLKLWVPRDIPPPSKLGGGVFDHLRQKPQQSAIELPVTNITWEKFQRTILGNVLEMEVLVKSRDAFCGLMTAADPEAPAILQWDGLEGYPRNPASWYYWNGGSAASAWGLTSGWNKVTCVFPNPSKWQEPEKFKHQKNTIHFAIAGCVESNPRSLALFPETLKSELHGVRSVIEAHSNRMGGEGAAYGSANGLTFDGSGLVTLRVRTPEGFASYMLDRMD